MYRWCRWCVGVSEKIHVELDFQLASAVQSILVGQDVVVACLNIIAVFGWLGVYIVLVPFPAKIFLAIGPQHPKGSIANGNNTMFLSKSSWIIFSPKIVYPSEECGLSCCTNFFFSKFCKCRLAAAKREEIALSENWKEELCAQSWAIVMSVPMVVTGHVVCDVSSCGSGSKEISKGCALLSD